MDVSFDFKSRRAQVWGSATQAVESLPATTTDMEAGFLVSNPVNVRYLSGFTGSNGFLAFDASGCTLLTDGRYTTQAATECPDLSVRIRPLESSMLELIAETLRDSPSGAWLIESSHVSREFHRDLAGAIEKNQLLDSKLIVENLRQRKDEQEILLIRKSIEINQAAAIATLKSFESSWSEKQFSWELERNIRELGGDGFSFAPIVAAGPSSAMPHYRPSGNPCNSYGFMLLDWGSNFHGYASDITRMVAFAEIPDSIKQIHSVVADAKQAAIEAVKDGADLKDVDTAARGLIKAAGFGDQFNHGLGHGFGLEIHESPFISPAFDGQLSSGMVITIEPGIYLPEIGGVRLEDDILVTDDGCVVLSDLSNDFFQAG